MKQGIHPNYNLDTTVVCTCGNTFVTGSVLPTIKVEICSKCHPFYTGTQKIIDTEGRVNKFAKRQAAAQAYTANVSAKVEAKNKKAAELKNAPRSLYDLMEREKSKSSSTTPSNDSAEEDNS